MRTAIDRRTTRYLGCGKSQRIRKRIEEAFGWMKTIGDLYVRSCRLQPRETARAADGDGLIRVGEKAG